MGYRPALSPGDVVHHEDHGQGMFVRHEYRGGTPGILVAFEADEAFLAYHSPDWWVCTNEASGFYLNFEGMGRACYRAPKATVSRYSAWLECRRVGRSHGIPDHAWGKNHSKDYWVYITLKPEAIAQRRRAMERRRREEE